MVEHAPIHSSGLSTLIRTLLGCSETCSVLCPVICMVMMSMYIVAHRVLTKKDIMLEALSRLGGQPL